jgi:CheY-like chemotaxis protein
MSTRMNKDLHEGPSTRARLRLSADVSVFSPAIAVIARAVAEKPRQTCAVWSRGTAWCSVPAGMGEGARRVLVVDDDRLLGETLRMMIADFATFDLAQEIAVDVVTSGREAQRILEGDAAFYNAVICDLSMPGVDGLTLYEGLITRGSPLARRFVLVTGGAFTPAPAAAIERHALPYLQKPFDSAKLAETLRPFFR